MSAPAAKTTWYHGDRAERSTFRDQRWDRDAATSSLNAGGPGLYFTSKREEAETYGPYLYAGRLRPSFNVMPRRKPTMAFLRSIFECASDDDRERFIADYDARDRDDAIRRFLRQDTMLDAALMFYGELLRNPEELVSCLVSLGYHGAIIPRNYGVRHLVVWDPSKMDIYPV